MPECRLFLLPAAEGNASVKGARESSFIIPAENVQWLSRTHGNMRVLSFLLSRFLSFMSLS